MNHEDPNLEPLDADELTALEDAAEQWELLHRERIPRSVYLLADSVYGRL